jgi:hypothetical protein
MLNNNLIVLVGITVVYFIKITKNISGCHKALEYLVAHVMGRRKGR